MKSIILLGLIGVIAIVVIAGIVVYQFIQQQAAIDLVNKQILKAEYKAKDQSYSREAVEKCSQFDNPNNLSETTPMQQKCYQDLMDKHGLSDKKYDSVRLDAQIEKTDALIEATDKLIECQRQGFNNC